MAFQIWNSELFFFSIQNRNTSPNNDNSSETESDGSSSDSSDSSNNVSKVESTTMENRKWMLTSFIKPEIQANKQQQTIAPLEPLPDTPPTIKREPILASPQRFGATTSIQSTVEQSHNNISAVTGETHNNTFLSPMCLTNEQIKMEPIGESTLS